MMIRTTLCALISVLALALPAGAQTSNPPKLDIAPMTYFVGLWNCKQLKNPDPKLVGTTFSFAGATDPGGYWEVLDLHDGRINITWDPASALWTFIYLGNGGDYSVMTTPGWTDKVLNLREVMVDGKAPLGEATFIKVGDMQYRATYTARTSAGTETFETVCTRV